MTLLQHFYPDFYRRPVNPNDDDPVRDVLTYKGFRSVTKQGGELDPPAVSELFVAKGLKPPPPHDDENLPRYLHDLEQELPIDFPALATDREFVSLVESLRVPMYSYLLRHILRRPLNPLPPATESAAAGRGRNFRCDSAGRWRRIGRRGDRRSTDIAHLRRATRQVALTTRLKELGAQVDTAVGRDSAVEVLRRDVPDLIVSNITRPGDPNGGFDDVAYFRDEDLFDGPVVFYTGEITPARQQRARELGTAVITNSPEQVLPLIAKAAADLDRSGGS